VDSVLYQAFDQRKITSVELPYASYIGEEAFDDCKSLTKVTFGPRLKHIEKWGFCNDPIEHDLIMPYGFNYLGYRAFQNAGSKRLLIPSSCTSCNKECFRGMKNLTELIVNSPSFAKSSWGLDFTDVPSACKVLVPTGQVQQFRNHADWKKFGNNIGAGAFDFNYGQWTSAGTSGYHMTITSTTPVTVDGVTYDGKAKYVYYPTIGTKTGFSAANSETDNMYNSGKKYLITEIGDSCLFRASGITAVSLENLRSLTRIGAYAFTGSGVKTITVPENCTSFGYNAFYGATSLEDLTILGTNGRSWDGQFIGNNASNFTMYVHFQPHYSWYNSQMGTWTIGSKKGTDIVNPYIPAENTTQEFASVVPVDFSASGVNAYIVTGYNTANATLTTQQVQRVPAETGVIITDLTAGKIYKMKRPTSSVSAPMTNYLASSASTNTDVYNKTVGYYWSQSNKKFVKPTSTFKSGTGRSYLLLTSNAAGSNKNFYLDIFPNTSAKKGDVNADGKIDVVDLNIVINIILGSDQASKYNGRADVTGDSKVDIVDVNAVINLILGV
ncbi:MAG: leucine-rich repeat protein, partial [Bacteroidales bacterium]|nr:leucine-rich repeat protein [Candidatus Sodaliphilus aphodohippi]